jgi:hypothetical protein
LVNRLTQQQELIHGLHLLVSTQYVLSVLEVEALDLKGLPMAVAVVVEL